MHRVDTSGAKPFFGRMTCRVTQKAIATRLGFHQTTICLALRGHASIPLATQDLIRRTARKMGYQRDPMLGALASYRRTVRPRSFQGVLGWLVSTSPDWRWQGIIEYKEYYEGARRRAAELGYKLMVFDLKDYSENLDRLSQVFTVRNIQGVLICPQPHAHTVISMRFDDVASVAFGYSVRSPATHVVTSHHHRSVAEAFRRLRERGYGRIGYAICNEHEERVENHYIAGFLTEQRRIPARDRIPPIGADYDSVDTFRAWMRRHRPDALITDRYNIPARVASLGLRVPEDVGLAVIGVVDECRHFTGIEEGSVEIGKAAVEFIVSMIERGERGIPTRPHVFLVDGNWYEGETLRAPEQANADDSDPEPAAAMSAHSTH